MSRHARATSGRGGGWFIALAFAVLVVGAYLANAVDATSQRPAIGLAALAAAGLALVSARAERQTRERIEELNESRRRDAWRMRSELDEAHARSHRALQRAIAAETAVHTLMAATESLLAVRHALMVTSVTPEPVVVATAPSVPAPLELVLPPAPMTPPLPLPAPAVIQPAVIQPAVIEPAAAAYAPPQPVASPRPVTPPAAPVAPPLAPAAALAPAATLIWPLAEVPAPRREPSLDLPLVPAPSARVSPLFVPVESPGPRAVPSSTTATSAGTEPSPVSELVDVTSTITTRYARPA
jgi:hypothetical protein